MATSPQTRSSVSSIPTNARRTTTIFAVLLAVVMYIDRITLSQAAPLIRKDLNLTTTEMAWAFSMFGWAYALFEIPGGWLGDRIGPRRVLMRIVIWWSFFTAATGMVFNQMSLVITQALFGVVQGAQYEDLRRQAARGLTTIVDEAGRGFDGYGIGGALEKQNLATIVGWVSSELPADKPRHLLGISEPDDLFDAVSAGADTFDCVSPSRVARNAAVYTATGRFNITNARYRRDFTPVDDDCDCYTCGHYTRAYLHHLFKAKEILAATLCTINNERFVIRLVDQIRAAIRAGEFDELRAHVLGRYYSTRTQ